MSFSRSWSMWWMVTMGLASGCLNRPLSESRPETNNVFVDNLASSAVKIDLLFMVDNSASMGDKQDILREAVPVLVSRLTTPQCVDPVTSVPTGEKGKCTRGEPEFPAVSDIHVGIVTSSLGAHGGYGCSAAESAARPDPGSTPDDKAHLLGKMRPPGSNPNPSQVFDVARTWSNSGFLAWDASQTDSPPGVKDATAFQQTFQDLIVAAGEKGCGYEASLESWYRFLVDPEPPLNVTVENNAAKRSSALVTNPDGSTTCQGCDLELLAERKAFLRPDSLVAIIMLSDENDCSVRDDGYGWWVTVNSRLPRASAACANDPNDKCCRSCIDPLRAVARRRRRMRSVRTCRLVSTTRFGIN